ncbi:MAG: hypothetical protein JWL69_4603, partial [Phycisphaerales bacterium]|nr:hypothetical protein [Phycisphaerales bacterium]
AAPVRAAPTTRGADDDDLAPELAATLDRIIPADVREGRRAPTDREKMASFLAMMLALSDNGLNDEKAKKYREQAAEVEKAINERYKELWAENEHASPQLRQELAINEKLAREMAHLLDFMDRPTKFPTTRDSDLDLVRRVNQIPQALDRAEALDRDSKYHDKRLELLQEIEELRNNPAQPGRLSKSEQQKLDADTALLAALDAEYAAQVKADRIKLHPTTAP